MSYDAVQGEHPNHPPRSLSLFLLCFSISLLCTGWAGYVLMNGDMASITMFSEEMLRGKQLYVDLITSQPPLIMYICMIPVALHWLTGLSVPSAFVLFIFTLFNLCVLLSWCIARRNSLCQTLYDSYLILCAMYCGVFLLTFVGQRYLHSFGQKENMLCALMLPYIMLMMNRLQGSDGSKAEQVAVGILGAIGFLIKPQFLLFFVLSEIYVMIARRRLFFWNRIDAWIIAIAAIAYALFIILCFPEFLALIGRLVLNYSGYESSLAYIAVCAITTMLPAVIVVYCMRRSPHILELLYFVVLISGGEILYILPKLPYYYHILPILFLTLLLFVFAKLAAKDSKPASISFPYFLVYALLTLAAVSLVGMSFIDTAFLYSYVGPAAVLPVTFYIIARLISGDKKRVFMVLPQYFLVLAVLTTPVDPSHYIHRREEILSEAALLAPYKTVAGFNSDNLLYFPLIMYTDARWDMTLVYLEYLPAAYAKWKSQMVEVPYHTLDKMDENERFFHEKIIKDLQRLPEAIIVDEGQMKAGFGRYVTFDYIRYFMQDPRFRELWSHYEFVTRFHRSYNNITRQPEDSTDAIYRRKDLAQ